MIKKIRNSKFKVPNFNAGMTYVELIVVMSIFSIMAGISIYNYHAFQAKIDIKNLANDIALKMVQAQKDSSFGKIPPTAQYALVTSPATWKPAYGVYFDIAPVDGNKSFIYFTDTNSDNSFPGSISSCTGDCLEKISITKGNSILAMTAVGAGAGCSSLNSVTVVFTRPSSAAVLSATSSGGACTSISSATITVRSPQGNDASVSVYSSGRIQIN